MFVNISPADYNSEETVTSLSYAARVKLIKNNASKQKDSEEVTRLKRIIAALKDGRRVEGLDDLDLTAPTPISPAAEDAGGGAGSGE